MLVGWRAAVLGAVLVAPVPCLGCDQGEVAPYEGKETCISARHLRRDDGDRAERGERRRRATASDVVSNAKSHTPAHRRESCAARTAHGSARRVNGACVGARAATAGRPTDLVVGRPTDSSASSARRRKTHGAGGLGIERCAFRFRWAVCSSACVLGPLGCAAAGLALCLLGLLVLLLWWFVVCWSWSSTPDPALALH